MSDDVTARLAEIEARANAATKGPWETRGEGRDDTGDTWIRILGDIRNEGRSSTRVATVDTFGFIDDETAEASFEGETDAEFIAHARADVPWLIEQAREAHKTTFTVDDLRLIRSAFEGMEQEEAASDDVPMDLRAAMSAIRIKALDMIRAQQA